MGKRGPKPGFKRAPRSDAVAPSCEQQRTEQPEEDDMGGHEHRAVEPVADPVSAPVSRDPLQRARQINGMPTDELMAYAKQVGVPQRDIDGLSLDRLRQNCHLTVARLVEAYTE